MSAWNEIRDGREIRRHSHDLEGRHWWQIEGGTWAELVYCRTIEATPLGALRAFLRDARQAPDDYSVALRLIGEGGPCQPMCFAGPRRTP